MEQSYIWESEWWPTPVISILRGLRRRNTVWLQSGLHYKTILKKVFNTEIHYFLIVLNIHSVNALYCLVYENQIIPFWSAFCHSNQFLSQINIQSAEVSLGSVLWGSQSRTEGSVALGGPLARQPGGWEQSLSPFTARKQREGPGQSYIIPLGAWFLVTQSAPPFGSTS